MKTSYLHLRRRKGQSILVGEHPHQVTITVGEFVDDEINLQFFAPVTVPIDRMEVAVRKGRPGAK
jgi:sRNA-binding carbon storage regulator CsrA